MKLKKKLNEYAVNKVIFTKEPGGTKLGEIIKNLIVKKDNLSKETQLLLLLAARNEHYLKLIKPFLSKKYLVICDRFIDSTYAYQCGNNKELNMLYFKLNKLIINNFMPDLTIFLDISANEAIKRIKKRKSNNKFDFFSINFFNAVRKSYLKNSYKNKRFYIIDAKRDRNDIHEEVLEVILKKIRLKDAK